MSSRNSLAKIPDGLLLSEEQVAKLIKMSKRFVAERLGHLARRAYRKADVDAWIDAQPSLPPLTARRDVRGKVCARRRSASSQT